MFFIAFTFKGHEHVFALQVKVVSHSSCRTSPIFKYFCPLVFTLYLPTGPNTAYGMHGYIRLLEYHLPIHPAIKSYIFIHFSVGIFPRDECFGKNYSGKSY